MKKYFIVILAIFLIFALIPGCGDNSEKNQGPSEALNELEEAGEALEDLEEAMSFLANPGWPTGKISDKIPEYPYGEVTNSRDFGDGEYAITISPTNKEELEEYFNLLESQGFTITDAGRGARLGTVAIRTQFKSSDTLQLIVSDLGTSEWPAFPGELLPPDKGILYGEVHIPTLSDSDKASGHYYSASFTLVDLTEEDGYAFVDKQVDNGWSGGYDMASKEVQIDGVTCELMFQFVQYDDEQADFILEAWAKQ